jgi:hypothetical protein
MRVMFAFTFTFAGLALAIAGGGECDSRFTPAASARVQAPECKRQSASARVQAATENTLGRNRAYASTRVERM